MRVAGKVAIVTGAAHGMGAAEARLLAQEGAKVVVADIQEQEGEAVAAAIRADNGEAVFMRLDVTSDKNWEAVIAATIARYGRLDILVNNAGISSSAAGDWDGEPGWDLLLNVNAKSVFLGTRRAVKEMAKTGGGSIVNISSILALVGSATNHPAYHASKAAVRNYTKAAAVRYGPQNIRVNSIHPGFMPLMRNAVHGAARDMHIAHTPLRRFGETIEVANAVLFLASDEASFITAAELTVDGGYIAQ